MPAFPGVDFLDVDSPLQDEELLARKTAREFVDEYVIPVIEKHNRAATFPMELVPKLAELGFFGANLEGYGCAGMSNVAYGLVTQALERGDSGLRSFVSVQSALVMYPIHTYGSPAQKDKWLPWLQSGKAIGCFGLTEPQVGSNPAGMLTRAVRRGVCYVLNGEKMWITNGSIADVALVWAKCEDDKIRGFLVEKGTKGFKAWDVHGKLSLRATATSALAINDCAYPTVSDRRGDGVLRHRAAVCQDTQAISEQTDRVASARAGQAGIHDHGNIEGATPRAACGPPKRSEPLGSIPRLHAEDEQRVDGHGNGAQGARH